MYFIKFGSGDYPKKFPGEGVSGDLGSAQGDASPAKQFIKFYTSFEFAHFANLSEKS
ncbi:conserved hypothetical protein [Leptospira interrogans serovar Manilae]|uniref:Uncharacterized protein n=1 Tax=Leptospira interrogans serovar Manilae TaxID=214675 RepID=A0AAQ1NXZ7_LEPIR|nr:conserved hypothetical protein [Leptospira interrogans serovar Manilae]